MTAPVIAAEAPAPAPPVLDVEVLDEICCGDASFRTGLLEQFRRSCAGLFAELEAAARESDAARLGETAHRLKGAALSIGAGALAAVLLEVERSGDGGDASAARRWLARARPAREELDERLERELARAA